MSNQAFSNLIWFLLAIAVVLIMFGFVAFRSTNAMDVNAAMIRARLLDLSKAAFIHLVRIQAGVVAVTVEPVR